MATNMEQTIGYGEDEYCKKAAEAIRRICHDQDAAVHFLVGGTQTNATVIAAALRPYQGVIAAATGHICVHESGAIEATGHKVIALPTTDGKLSAEQIRDYVDWHRQDESYEHIVMPGMVYISNPTELGTIYSKKELQEISHVCRDREIYLYLDGARLGYGLGCRENDLDLPTIHALCDVFYIGGTKVGTLFGEAVVIRHEAIKKDFRFLIKQRGGMLAKGRLLGIQFLTLFEDGLYFEMGRHGAVLAEELKDAITRLKIPFFIDSPTNQQFIILPDSVCKKLREKYDYEYQQRVDKSHSAIRFCTSWATKAEEIKALINDLEQALGHDSTQIQQLM
jgi:threonine aldolase